MSHVVLVGHCGPDAYLLRNVVHRVAPDRDVKRADDDASLESLAPGAALLLINRRLDGAFTNASGVELIREIRDRRGASAPAMILVSNFADAQAMAQANGALPGFGKAELNRALVGERLRAALSN
ncbi:MAG: hypothetical protein H6811_02355 [Phycisphaeraceae bacterium]|nr:hypothetical protein [Phycisphaeraceae bacterium]